MPAPKKRFYSTKDVETILGISRSKATQIMHIFDKHGQLLRIGQAMRVEIDTFEQWLADQQQGGIKGEQNRNGIGYQRFRSM